MESVQEVRMTLDSALLGLVRCGNRRKMKRRVHECLRSIFLRIALMRRSILGRWLPTVADLV